MRQKKTKVVFLLSKILGGKTFSSYIENTISKIPDIDPIILDFTDIDYTDENFPKRTRSKNRDFPSLAIKAKYEKICNHFDPDILFFQSMRLVRHFKSEINQKKTILALDSTDIQGHYLHYNANRSVLGFLRYKLVSGYTSLCYRDIVRSVKFFIPRTTWCAQSLKKDYHVDEQNIAVCPGGIDVDYWKATLRPQNSRPRLLSVGNDFKRKGGYFLLKLYKNYLRDKMDLVILSNDPVVNKIDPVQGLIIKRGLGHDKIHEIISIYNSCDIFIYPTFSDQMGQVLLEASSMGLPIVGRNVGGTSEFIINNHTGFLMPYDSAELDWVHKLEALAFNEPLRKNLGFNARVRAIEKYSSIAFVKIMNMIFANLAGQSLATN